ncbi:ATP-binding protein [Ancylobacter radicis]|uniref:AAA family ATPase n=1 Tax=Ancylobacter radicis TaxID=2836179 RepID=A0ABS5R5M5_9HYPH|nr:YhaN family protein [Ancylobacter radicis]MBS9476953.1 AAA family ATPase [Ancylobacter radicis]
MRFARLSLERYGRFERCELDFRAGSPDLHVIYGANEAGKTTSLAAVSDLLFGFPTRSPYNFLFDNALLRVGAVLEEGGRRLVCRRRKGTTGTLLDAGDVAMDEAPLLAMLKGQTRETFGLSFSLDQNGLRAGGRAMVEAKNDLGRTLFAAGSGLTGIADELKTLDGEVDAIWGPKAAKHRTFTKAQEQLATALKAIRDDALKPKAWSEARQAAERARAALEAARGARDAVQAGLRAADRVRRLAPLVRRRQEHLDLLGGSDGTADLGKPREDGAETIIQEADEAQRQKAAADQLRAEASERHGTVAADPAILARAEEIDQLVADAGAGEKAARDLVRLEPELLAAEALTARLRAEAGGNADVAPTRAGAAKLRDLARLRGEIAAAGRQIEESRADIEERRMRAQARLEASVAASPAGAGFDPLIDAVNAARALGADADARGEAARRRAEASLSAVAPLLARLVPWRGSVDELAALPRIGEREIEAARAEIADIAAGLRREEEQVQRSTDQIAAVELAIEQLATGAVVSPEDIAAARRHRQDRWQPIRDHVLGGAELSAPEAAVAEFEASLAQADERMELRFRLADASSRLALLEQDKARHALEAQQATARAAEARRRHERALEAWGGRLSGVGLPALDPSRFLTWQADREAAEAAHQHYLAHRAECEGVLARRDACRALLAEALGSADTGGPLAPLLAIAERRRAEAEGAVQRRRLAQEQLDQIAAERTTLERRQQRLDADSAATARAWEAALAEAGLQMDSATCGAVLDLLDELRQAQVAQAELRRRVEGIRRDARDHVARVDALADQCGLAPADTSARVRALRERLAAARANATLLGSLEEDMRRRAAQAEDAGARLRAADEALAPLLAQTGARDRAELSAAIERSRARRRLLEELAATERRILDEGDGMALDALVAGVTAADPGALAGQISALEARLKELNDEVDQAATAHGDARSAFAALNSGATSAVGAAADAEQARAEMEVLAEHYILKRAQALTLKWAIETYRERHQDPLLLRAGELFSTLTTGRYVTLRVDADGASPRLLGLRDDGRTMVEVGAMSEGTTDQLFLALRLAALEQSVAAGVNLPFLADDLFVNFDDQRAEAGFRVLAEVATSTQVLFFTHHPHLMAIARHVVGADLHSECALA